MYDSMHVYLYESVGMYVCMYEYIHTYMLYACRYICMQEDVYIFKGHEVMYVYLYLYM